MGREIRRVPRGWEHPRNELGRYKPLHDQEYEAAAQQWVEGFLLFEKEKKTGKYGDVDYYWEWEGDPPDPDFYRPKWAEEPRCYQVYENVSEGTPISPVFETKEEMEVWLRDPANGFAAWAIEYLLKSGYAPSMIGNETGIHLAQDARGRGR